MLAYRPAGGLEGHYRFGLTGTDHVTVNCQVNQIFNLPELEGMELFGQFVPGHQILIQRNSTSSAWVDVVELIHSRDVVVFDKKGQPANDSFLGILMEARLELPHAGEDKSKIEFLYYNLLV
jgi:hypothetical protein